MRFTRLHLENWRNFLHADVRLGDRVFIVGPNASGKSNLLQAFRFLNEVVSVGGGFRSAVERRSGVSHIRCLAARSRPDVVLEVEVAPGRASTESWTYRLAFTQDNQRLPILTKEVVRRGEAVVLERPDAADRADPERLRQTHLEQINANREFRELHEFFGSIRYLHIVPQILREPDRALGRKDDPFGGDFLERMARTPQRTREARLRRILEALKIAVPQLTDLVLERDEKGTPHLRGLYEHWRPNAGWQGEDEFSDGTLRLLGLLWSVLDGDGPLLLEEPELSLHPEIVRHIPQTFQRMLRRRPRQVLIATHSRDLLADAGIGGEEVLFLQPGSEGTQVLRADSDEQLRALLDGGATVAEAVLPRTRPATADQLTLFGE